MASRTSPLTSTVAMPRATATPSTRPSHDLGVERRRSPHRAGGPCSSRRINSSGDGSDRGMTARSRASAPVDVDDPVELDRLRLRSVSSSWWTSSTPGTGRRRDRSSSWSSWWSWSWWWCRRSPTSRRRRRSSSNPLSPSPQRRTTEHAAARTRACGDARVLIGPPPSGAARRSGRRRPDDPRPTPRRRGRWRARTRAPGRARCRSGGGPRCRGRSVRRSACARWRRRPGPSSSTAISTES